MKPMTMTPRAADADLRQQTFDADPDAARHQPLGAIIQRGKGLDDEQIQRALAYQRERGGRVGEALMALGLAEESEVAWALSQQFPRQHGPAEQLESNPELIVANDPFGEEAEAFRDLRTHLLMGALAPELPPAALAVVSPNVGDGKSFVAANLALSFAQLEGRTLLVDCDMRTPRLDRMFDLERGHGLAALLIAPADDQVIRAIPGLPNLFLLPAGIAPPNSTELLQRAAFPLLLRELQTKFDHVIVDTPAASLGSDARMIAMRCGAALVIGRKDHSRATDMRGLLKHLDKSAVRVAGIMLNEH